MCGFLSVHYKRTELVSWEHKALAIAIVRGCPLVGGSVMGLLDTS